MKRLLLCAAMLLMSGAALMAQDCEALLLPYFNGDAERMAQYPAEKFEWRCTYARNSFYVSDTVPTGAVVKPISEVRNKQTGEAMPNDVSIDLNTLSFYAYNFNDMQLVYPKCDVTICFETPGSEHPYLVLRSIDETYFRSAYPEQYINK